MELKLRNLPCKLEFANDGQAAIEAVRTIQEKKCSYALVLMDMQMPNVDGYTATRTLRQDGYDAPIVAITAHAMVKDREKCIAVGCNDYVSKPFEWKALEVLISKYLTA